MFFSCLLHGDFFRLSRGRKKEVFFREKFLRKQLLYLGLYHVTTIVDDFVDSFFFFSRFARFILLRIDFDLSRTSTSD